MQLNEFDFHDGVRGHRPLWRVSDSSRNRFRFLDLFGGALRGKQHKQRSGEADDYSVHNGDQLIRSWRAWQSRLDSWAVQNFVPYGTKFCTLALARCPGRRDAVRRLPTLHPGPGSHTPAQTIRGESEAFWPFPGGHQIEAQSPDR